MERGPQRKALHIQGQYKVLAAVRRVELEEMCKGLEEDELGRRGGKKSLLLAELCTNTTYSNPTLPCAL